MDKKAIEAAIAELLKALGEQVSSEKLKETPARMAELYTQLLSGKHTDLKLICQATHETEHKEMVFVKDIAFYSLCEHHLLPFFGKCHIAYIPHQNMVLGISRLAELVEAVSRKLQIQECMTKEIADALNVHLKPRGVAVVVEARHLCMEMRGKSRPETEVITSAVRGIFRENSATRAEFFALLNRHK